MATPYHLQPLELAATRHAMAFATTLDGTIVYANARYLAACRAAPHRVVGTRHPLIEQVKTHHAEGGLWQGQFWSAGPDGHTLRIDATVLPRFDETGTLCGYLCLATDLGHDAMPVAMPSAGPFAAAFGVFLMAPDGELLYISDEIHSRYAQLPEAFGGHAPALRAIDAPHPPASFGWQAWLESGATRFEEMLALSTRSGERESVRVCATRLIANGSCIGIAGVLQQKQQQYDYSMVDAPLDPTLASNFETLLANTAKLIRSLLQGGQLHDVGELESFLRAFTLAALRSQPALGILTAEHLAPGERLGRESALASTA